MSEYEYGVCDHDSDVWCVRRVNESGATVYVVYTSDERERNHSPYPHFDLTGLPPAERVKLLRTRAKWYHEGWRVKHGLGDIGSVHEFDTTEQANAFLQGARAMGYWVPDRMFFVGTNNE